MAITVIDSAWCETGIVCPFCNDNWMTYSDGKSRPQCANPQCLKAVPDDTIWQWLITLSSNRFENSGIC